MLLGSCRITVIKMNAGGLGSNIFPVNSAGGKILLDEG
jgi:hypothetical protein